MATIGATVHAWREIMGVNTSKFNGPDIENYLKAEFGQDFFSAVDKNNSDPLVQFADQSLCSYKIKKCPEKKWTASIKRECPRRIDGNTLWLNPQEWQELDLYRIDDVRIPPKAYTEEQWDKLRLMMDRVFSDKKFDKVRELFIKYRNDYVSST
uniref:Phosphoenolpyruvate carboxykinase n=1 Tax=Panagrellus redivivus TaxID=6233 RepID=A0A7E4W2H3_PANRE